MEEKFASKNKIVSLKELIHFTSKQIEATEIADKNKYTLFGGSAGPGKSYWLRWYIVRTLIKWGKEYNLKGIRGALFCEDYPTLKDRQISKMEVEFPRWLGEIKDSKTDGLAFHINQNYGGHVMVLRNLDDPSKYLSSEFAIIGVEELTQNEEEKFHRLRSRLRWTGILNPKFIGATNPGGRGHEWVKKRWIDKKYPPEEKEADLFAYVPAKPTDNPYLAESYIQTLKSLPEKLRKAYLDGNWDVFEGQYFSEWDEKVHVVEPFVIPESWVKIRGVDPSGRSGTTSSHIYAVDTEGTVWVIREHYKSGLDADQHAREIAQMSGEFNIHYTVIDSAAFSRLGLPETMAEIYERNGVNGLVSSSKDRVVGWNIVHQFLRYDELNAPKLKIFKTCPNLIRTIPLVIHNENRPEDIETSYIGTEHNDALDELRYVLQTLREQKSPKPLSLVERRLQELKEKEENFNYRYSRSVY